MSLIDRSVFKRIEERLMLNQEVRRTRGGLLQNLEAGGRLPGEVFYGNLKQAEFDALPLKCKRKGGPARTSGVFSKTYEELYKDKESFAVFLHTYELDMLGIKYK